MKHNRFLSLLIYAFQLNLIIIHSTGLNAQEMMVWEPNVYSLTAHVPHITNELIELSDPSVYTHPEFGILPEDAPCQNCVELIDRRTIRSRYFVENGTNGNSFYVQTSYGDLHFTDSLGRLISYDRRIEQINDKLYIAQHQLTPTYVDVEARQTGFKINGDYFAFNNNLQLQHILPGGEIESLGHADWSDKTIGDHGIYIKNAWPNIDIKITFDLNMVKSNFVIKAPLDFEEGYLGISDDLILPDNYALELEEGETGAKGWDGSMIIAPIGEPAYGFEIGRAIAMDDKLILDKDSIGIHEYNPEYLYDSATQNLTILVSMDWLNNPELIYPVVIDPLITSTSIYGSVIKFRINGEWCGGATYCEYTLDCTLPANSTITGATFSSQYITTAGTCAGSCWLLDAGFRMWSDSCSWYSPDAPNFWSCWMSAAPGTCTAVNYDMSDLVTCLTPKCSGSIPIDMRTSYCYCNANGTCPVGAAVPCHRMNASSWSVTISGNTVEATALAAGATSYTVIDCADQSDWLTPAYPIYGVPGYTYSWSPIGSVEDSVYQTFPLGSTVYTLTITDACGITATDVVTVINNCLVLPLDLVTFTGYYLNGLNYLKWETSSIEKNKSFILERSNNGLNFEEIGIVTDDGTTNNSTNYFFVDNSPFESFNYYRLKQLNTDESVAYSEIIVIKSFEIYNTQIIVNAQNSNENILDLTIFSAEAGQGEIQIIDMSGNLMLTKNIVVSKGSTAVLLSIPEIKRGVYVVAFSKASEFAKAKFIK